MIRLTPITPSAKAITFTRFAKAAEQGMEDAAKDAVKDFEATTATWATKVEFGYKKHGDGYQVGPTSGDTKVYGYVDTGTRAHLIVARRAKRLRFIGGYRAKTRPGFIGSQSGGARGGAVFRRAILHPGTTARGFSKLIKRKWEAQLAKYIQKRIREVL